MRIPGDVIVRNAGAGRWVLYNVFTQRALGVETEGLGVLTALAGGSGEDPAPATSVRIWEIEHFGNYDGLFADPARVLPVEGWGAPQSVPVDRYRDALRTRGLLVEDDAAYHASLGLKTSLLDRGHVGNFHQQLGQHLLVERRENPEEWWLKQKFTVDRRGLGDNLYRAVQEPFVQQVVASRFQAGTRVLDVGCGIGYYTKQFGQHGAQVTGVDPNAAYIVAAQADAPANVTFTVAPIGAADDLAWLEPASFDFVFMSDVLLFYFVSPGTAPAGDLQALFASIRRLLKPTGRYLSLEPHGTYFLRPWWGEPERPFTIVTEHRHPRFGVAPTVADACAAFMRGGFCVMDYQELYAERAVADPRAASFAREYPLWSYFDLALRPA